MQHTYATVKEFAVLAGVTPQAIYKRMPTDLQPYIKLDGKQKTIDTVALKFFETFEPQPLQTLEPTKTDETIDFLIMQLTMKDEQIKFLTEHTQELAERLKESNQLAISLQEREILQIPERYDDEEDPEIKEPWWVYIMFWKRKKD